MVEIDESRQKRQDEIIDKWKNDAEGKGTLEAATGFGKTYVALHIMRRMQKKYPHVNFQVVTPTNYLRKQWRSKVHDFDIVDVHIDTVQYLTRNYSGNKAKRKSTILIPDEIHKYGGPQFRKVFDAIKYKYILGLTATVPQGEKRKIIKKYAPVFEKVPLSECREKNWVSSFNVYNLGVDMSREEREEYNYLDQQFYKFFSWFDWDFNEAKRCLNDDGACRDWASKINKPKQTVKGFAANCFKYMRERKNMLYKLPSKMDKAVDIAKTFPDKTIIMFGQSTDFADDTAKKINRELGKTVALPYHSNLEGREINGEYHGKKRVREFAVNQFSKKSSDIKILTTAEALDMGADIPEVDIGVTLAGTSSKRQFTQRTGRIIRKREGKEAFIIEVYAVDSQDEKWLTDRQKDLEEPAQYINSVDQII